MNIGTNGQLDLILGTMFSGKTTYLLSEIAKLAELNYKILYVNIEFDNRSDTIFSTHNPFFDNHVDFIKKESINKNVNMLKIKKLFDLQEQIINMENTYQNVTIFKYKSLLTIFTIKYFSKSLPKALQLNKKSPIITMFFFS